MGESKKTRHIVCAAIKYGDIVVCSARHFDPGMTRQLREMWKDGRPSPADVTQGFIDQFSQFITREDAMDAVKESGQPLTGESHSERLYSEDLY